MLLEVEGVTKNHIRKRADFNADVAFNNFLNQIWEQSELEAMTNSLGVQQNSVVQIGDRVTMSFSSVEEASHAVSLRAVFVELSRENLRNKFGDFGSVILFVDHVEANNQIRVNFFTNTNVLYYFGHMCLADNLETGQTKFKFKVRDLLSRFIKNRLDDCKLVNEVDRLTFVVEEHAGDVTKFDNIDVLFKAGLDC